MGPHSIVLGVLIGAAGNLHAEHVGAKKLVAVHLPSAGIEQAEAEVLKQFRNAILLIDPLESICP